MIKEKIELTRDEAQLIFNSLSELPHKYSELIAGIFNFINNKFKDDEAIEPAPVVTLKEVTVIKKPLKNVKKKKK